MTVTTNPHPDVQLPAGRPHAMTGPTLAAERDDLLYRVKAAMAATPPEGLTTGELRVIVAVIEAAIDRPHPFDLIGNVVRLNRQRVNCQP